MLIKFAVLDFMEDRAFNNSTQSNMKNNRFIIGDFEEYCINNEILNIEGLIGVYNFNLLMRINVY